MELSKILTADNVALYEKLVKDMGENNTRFQKWWDDMGAKYSWESHPERHWEINSNSCEIFLVDK